MPNPIITLTTDFGYKDPFVGIMKGVILGINPSVTIIDITHGISAQNILEAAVSIEMSFKSFYNGSIHLVVVDPGVGTGRRPILVRTEKYYFIGPDNGIFSRIYNLSERLEVTHITSEHYFLPERSSTFHGRDIFAPAAAWLSRGINISKFGDPINDYVSITIPTLVTVNKNIREGEVIYIDRFGNAITNIRTQDITEQKSLKVMLKGKIAPLKDHYSQAEDDGLYSLINSFGYLELFVCRGNASSHFDIKVGEKVAVMTT